MIHKNLSSLISVDNHDLVNKSVLSNDRFLTKSNKTDNLSNYKESVFQLLLNYNQSQYNYYSLNTLNHTAMIASPLFFNKYSQSYDPEFFSHETLLDLNENPLFLEKHSKRVSQYCNQLGKALGFTDSELDTIELAGLLHDIGKTSIPKTIIKKETTLTPEEWKIMKTHTIIGYDILNSSCSFHEIAEVAKSHHERIDGKGYPNHLKGDEIPYLARVISIVDAYEAMTNDRPYRKAISKQTAIKELIKNSGTQFDSEIVDVFINIVLQ
jgi:putative nucleotidyltransferase with HDIG domain